MNNDTGIDRERFIGMNIHYYFYPLEYFLDAQLALGYRLLELWGGSPHIWVDHLSWCSTVGIKKQLAKNGQCIAVFTPEFSSYRYLLCSADSIVYRYSLEYYKNCLLLAAELGAKTMCINLTGRFRDENYDLAWNRCVESVAQLSKAAEEAGVTLAVETLSPCQACIMTSLEELKRLFNEVGSKQLKAVIDTVSLGMAGETLDQWFDAFGQDIVHVHLADGRNDGSHLVWGDGCFPLERYLFKLNERGYKGLISTNISSHTYFNTPIVADMENRNVLSKYFI